MCIDTNARCLYGPSTSDLSDREIVTVTPPLFYIMRRGCVDLDRRLKNDHRDFNCLVSMKPSLQTASLGMIFFGPWKVVGLLFRPDLWSLKKHLLEALSYGMIFFMLDSSRWEISSPGKSFHFSCWEDGNMKNGKKSWNLLETKLGLYFWQVSMSVEVTN